MVNMGSYATVAINSKTLFWYKNKVNPELMSLFDTNEKITLKGLPAFEYLDRLNINDYNPEDIEGVEINVYTSSAGILKKRLNILGFSESLVKSVFETCKREKIDLCHEMIDSYTSDDKNSSVIDIVEIYKKELNEIKDLEFNDWLSSIREYKNDPDIFNYKNGPLELIESANERVALYAVLESFEPESVVELDVSDLYDGGWISDEVDDNNSVDISWNISVSPPIILTEGVFDRSVLVDTISLLHPEISQSIKFLNTDYKTEGGASAVIKILKSFAAAGISNRILAILDNDTAAREAISTLNIKLPDHFKIILLPEYALLKDYPCIGPQGENNADVNGLAASIELYLGKDVLSNEDASLVPIQWTGYSTSLKSYQGSIIDKAIIQKRYKNKIKEARSNPSLIAEQDWSGVELIIENIIETLSELR